MDGLWVHLNDAERDRQRVEAERDRALASFDRALASFVVTDEMVERACYASFATTQDAKAWDRWTPRQRAIHKEDMRRVLKAAFAQESPGGTT